MGFFFSNLHIRKADGICAETVRTFLNETLEKRGFLPADDPESSDISVFVYDAGGKWLSVCSDGIDFYTDESIQDICNPFSDRFGTDILTISCFDSDCLLMNLLNRKRGTDAWVKIGHDPEVKRRSTPARWNGIINDIPLWEELLKKDYIFAEDSLGSLEPLLELEPGQGNICADLISEKSYTEHALALCYSLPEATEITDPPCFEIDFYNLMPCEMGKDTFIYAINRGKRTKGIAIAFSGDYVEQEEIRFRDVQLEYRFDRHPRPTVPLKLEKKQDQNGQWIYYAEVPQFIIPSVKKGLPRRKAREEEFKHGFGIRFTPEGNETKRLDITLHIIPLEYFEGQCVWCVWLHSSSKEAFIEEHDRTWGEFTAAAHQIRKQLADLLDPNTPEND